MQSHTKTTKPGPVQSLPRKPARSTGRVHAGATRREADSLRELLDEAHARIRILQEAIYRLTLQV
jgi:hypothetical protein